MSAYRIVQIACDGPDCTQAWPADFSDVSNADRQRAAAEAAGWVVKQGRGHIDFCPKCVARLTAPIEGNPS